MKRALVQYRLPLKKQVLTIPLLLVGVSLFVLGFAIGPLFWAPLSELFGRQLLFTTTYACLTIFNAAAAGSQNIQTLLIFRFFAGSFGSSPLTNAGGVLADMFNADERGMAMTLFAAAPFLGPGMTHINTQSIASSLVNVNPKSDRSHRWRLCRGNNRMALGRGHNGDIHRGAVDSRDVARPRDLRTGPPSQTRAGSPKGESW